MSEVYFAISLTEDKHFKIGETTDVCRRNAQLWQDRYTIMRYVNIEGEKSEREFVESYLRLRVERCGVAKRLERKKDYFEASTIESVKWIEERFDGWVREALAVMPKEQAKPQVPTHIINPPIPMADEIKSSLEKYGFWRASFQMDTEEQNILLHKMRTHFVPLGYRCEVKRNVSWAQFEILKIY